MTSSSSSSSVAAAAPMQEDDQDQGLLIANWPTGKTVCLISTEDSPKWNEGSLEGCFSAWLGIPLDKFVIYKPWKEPGVAMAR